MISKTLENEETLLEFSNTILTTHRIRQSKKSWNTTNITSIMLEQITSCVFKKKTNPILLFISLLCIIFGIYIIFSTDKDSGLIISAIGVLFFIIYRFLFIKVLIISSAAGKITINIYGSKIDKIIDIINTIESAKNKRFLQSPNTTKQGIENYDEKRYQPKF